jgi:long-chain acyl-CoA synthetase
VCVPLYDSLGENAVEYIIDHSESTFLVMSSAKMAAFTAALPKITQKLRGVVYWGSEDAQTLQEGIKTIASIGIKATSYEHFLAIGEASPQPPDPPAASDFCTIMYTSGTTGDPKGVLLTHSAIVSSVDALLAFMNDHNVTISHGKATYLSSEWLPRFPVCL